MDKPIGQMNAAELRAALDEFARSNQPQAQENLPPGVAASHSQPVKDDASSLYGESILRKRADQITRTERDFLAAGIVAALKELGY